MSFLIQGKYKKKKQTGNIGEITINVDPEYQELLRVFLKKMFEKKGDEFDFPFIANPDINKRNLKQNALMHRWYDIEAKALNAGLAGSAKHEFSGWGIYEDDLRLYCPKEEILIKADFLNMYKRKFRHTHILEDEGEYKRIQIWKTSSHFSEREMAVWITRIINRVAEYGLPEEIQTYTKSEWIEFQKWIAKIGIVLHSEEPCTKDEYKAKVPVCEASGIWLGGEGEIAHILHVGMGGNEEPEKDHPRNWLHLSTEIHRGIIHGKGWKAFKRLYPWLKYKINLAMRVYENEQKPEQGELISE
jgi:hypothetical protein